MLVLTPEELFTCVLILILCTKYFFEEEEESSDGSNNAAPDETVKTTSSVVQNLVTNNNPTGEISFKTSFRIHTWHVTVFTPLHIGFSDSIRFFDNNDSCFTELFFIIPFYMLSLSSFI